MRGIVFQRSRSKKTAGWIASVWGLTAEGRTKRIAHDKLLAKLPENLHASTQRIPADSNFFK